MSIRHPREFSFLKSDMDEAVRVLKAGGVVLYPTDTIWGLGCDATNSQAVSRIYEIKRRQDTKALILLANSDAMISRYIKGAPEVAWSIIELATKPTTIIFDQGRNLAPELLGEDGSVAFRLTKEEFSSQLCFHLQRPIVSTSANLSGQRSPRTFRDIAPEILSAVDYVVKYRQRESTANQPSSIIKLSENGDVRIIR